MLTEELHFGRAADRLRISQPSLSKAIARLERQVGVQLLDRDKRNVGLTHAGSIFLEETRRTMAQSDRAVRRAQLAESGQVGLVRLGFVASASTSLLPFLLRDFTRSAPTVTLELHEMSTSAQLRAIRNRDIDLALVRPPVWDQVLRLETIAEEPLVVGLPKSHRLAKSDEPISLSELASEDFIHFRREITPGFYDMLIGLCHKAGFNPNVAHECNSFMTALALVTGDLGITLLPKSLVPHLTRLGGRFREVRDPDATADWAIAWIEEITQTRPDVKGFVDVTLGIRDSLSPLLANY